VFVLVCVVVIMRIVVMTTLVQMLRLRRMAMGVFMLMRQLAGIRHAVMVQHMHLRCSDSAAVDLLNLERRTDIEGAHGVFEHEGGDACIEQGSQKHIAGSTGKAFEIGKTHETP
jgi:hypothetical protein